jgi:hypothetical protein
MHTLAARLVLALALIAFSSSVAYADALDARVGARRQDPLTGALRTVQYRSPGAAPVASMHYAGNIHGAPALAMVSFERLPEYVLMAGQIRSGQYMYTFRADLVGASGFGEMLSLMEGTRFQIRIDITGAGFALTSNPFGPGQPSTYFFARR